MSVIIDRILSQLDDQTFIEKLLSLSKADLKSFLLELYNRQANTLTPSDIVKAFPDNRFVAPAEIDPAVFHALEVELLEAAKKSNIETVLLSPAAPFGSTSTFGCVDQNNVISALRGTEILSDPSNMLALILADKIRRNPHRSEAPLHYAATARVVRAQPVSGKGFYSHFGIFCMVSSGKAEGSYACEAQLLKKQLQYYAQIIAERFHAKISIELRKRSGYPDSRGFFDKMLDTVFESFPDVPISFDDSDITNEYYKGINFKIYMDRAGETYEIGDGGFVDWITQMLGSKKERCLISGIGLDRLLLL